MTRVLPYGPGMSGPRKSAATAGRYNMKEIAARVDKRRARMHRTAKELYVDLGLNKWDWSKRIHNRGSSFTVEELGHLADLLDAPPGWPFLPEEFWEGRDPSVVKSRH